MAKTKEYSNGNVTVVWEAEKCIHSGICVKNLPEVFNPKERPWVNIDASKTQAIVETVKKCPSGALTYYMANKKKGGNLSEATTIEVRKNGPLLVHGALNVTLKDGTVEPKNTMTAFCRCGASANKPYCDGAHRKVGFEG